MNWKSIFLIALVACIGLASCGKSDQEKAEEFVKSLGKDTELLFTLPPSAPKCIFYAEDNLIKCHNVETDSTATIPYGDIDEESVGGIFAGKKNIMVIIKDYDLIADAYVYDMAKGKFSKIDACPTHMRITDTKLSQSNKSITFTCDTLAEAPTLGLFFSIFSSADEYYKLKEKVGYYQVVRTYNFDGKLIKTKKIPVSNQEWIDRERENKVQNSNNEESASSNSSPAVYRWECMKCGEVRESAESPSTYGCPYSGHMWGRQERVR